MAGALAQPFAPPALERGGPHPYNPALPGPRLRPERCFSRARNGPAMPAPDLVIFDCDGVLVDS
ncbi:MAG: hypothetical protein KDJ89_10030, partial [Notoacmeibacter sp.]|nr:hypothetical protein [Notoacmeibacter sp.]